MPVLDDDAFVSVAFADLDMLPDRDLHDLNVHLASVTVDPARVEQWRARISDILISRI